MNDHSKQKSVNSLRSVILRFGGVLTAASALTTKTFGGGLKGESLLVPASPSTPRDTQHRIPRNGVSLHVEDHGSGKPVLLLHGWPDSSYRSLHLRSVPARCSKGIAQLVPREPRAAPAGVASQTAASGGTNSGIWSSNDHYLDGERMKMSGQFVKARWRYEQIDDASHWIPLDAPDRPNQLLMEWLG